MEVRRLAINQVQVKREPHPLRHPARWPIALAFPLLVLGGAVMPWASVTRPLAENASPEDLTLWTTTVMSGFNMSGDGLSAFLLSLLLVGLALSREAATSRTRTVQLAPGLLGVAIFLIVLPGIGTVEDAVRTAVANGWPANLEPGLTIERFGSILAAIGGIATSAVIVLGNRPVPDPADGTALDRQLAVGLVVGAVGVALGCLVAIWLASLVGDEGFLSALVFLLLLWMPLGAAITVTTWRRWFRHRRTG